MRKISPVGDERPPASRYRVHEAADWRAGPSAVRSPLSLRGRGRFAGNDDAMNALHAGLTSLGAWLMPAPVASHGPADIQRVRTRVGLVAAVAGIAGIAATAIATSAVLGGLTRPGLPAPITTIDPAGILIAFALVVATTFAPQAIFRTHNAAAIKRILAQPMTPLRAWSRATLRMDAVLVGAMISALLFPPSLMLALFGLAFIVRVMVSSKVSRDPNARLHAVEQATSAFVTGAVAYAILRPLAAGIITDLSIVSFLLAALVGTFAGLVVDAVHRWSHAERRPWAFAFDVIDIRRVIAIVLASVIAWVAVWVAGSVDAALGDPLAVGAALIGMLTATWLLLWVVSISAWRAEGQRALTLWSAHQAQIVARLTDGSLDPAIAAKAAAPTATRMAIVVFGARQAMTTVDAGSGGRTRTFVSIDRYEAGPTPTTAFAPDTPQVQLRLYADDDHPNASGIALTGWLTPGRFLLRSPAVVNRFREIATAALLTPVLAAGATRDDAIAEGLLDAEVHWPAMSAFNAVAADFRRRCDAAPHLHSLVFGVFEIDDFAAIRETPMGRLAATHLLRTVTGFGGLDGHDAFVAYEEPGRVWVALGGGPVIRSSVGLLRELHDHVETHARVPAPRRDVEVSIGVSFGHSAYLVDDLTYSGMVETARERLAQDQALRSPMLDEVMLGIDTVEALLGVDAPISAEDLVSDLRIARTRDALVREIVPIEEHGQLRAAWLRVGWPRRIGHHDLTDAEHFLAVADRQPSLGAEAARAIVDLALRTRDELAEHAMAVPLLVPLPAVAFGSDDLSRLARIELEPLPKDGVVYVADQLPRGCGPRMRELQALGVDIAVTAAAAASADAADLADWQCWAIVFPALQGQRAIDDLVVQQTTTAVASPSTLLVTTSRTPADRHGHPLLTASWARTARTADDLLRSAA